MRSFNMFKLNIQYDKIPFKQVLFEIAILDAAEQTLHIGYYTCIYKSIKLRRRNKTHPSGG